MKKIAIIGGGIAGLAAAYELEKQRLAGVAIDWSLYEASPRLGGIVETTRHESAEGRFILEGGPDAWVTDKPWARDLAIELGLESQLIASNDSTRKTYILIDGKLQPMPDRMRMMVPEDLATLDDSPLFSAEARAAYAAEPTRANELRAAAPKPDESVATFIRRHFGDEVLTKIGAPLLSGVFGGDVAKLSVQAVMPAFVAMEREHGSLITAVQAKARSRGNALSQPTFTTLRDGVATLTEALIATLPADRIHLTHTALSLKREAKLWCLRTSHPRGKSLGKSKKHFHHILLATSLDAARTLLTPIVPDAPSLLPREASSAVLVSFAWPAATAQTLTIPSGFGFLVPPNDEPASLEPAILACTFVDQKFPDRAPANARLIRVFFGGESADALADTPDSDIAAMALTQLAKILGPLPTPELDLTTVRRWSRSLPQYEVGHLDRMKELDARIQHIGGLTLLGNSYRGVGLPDLIRDARSSARSFLDG